MNVILGLTQFDVLIFCPYCFYHSFYPNIELLQQTKKLFILLTLTIHL